MTKKTYRELATEIGRIIAQSGNGNSETWEIIDAMCDAMKSDNRAFNKDRFVEAIETSRQEMLTNWNAR